MNGSIQRIYNPGVGKYDVAITVGPSYNTKRMEAAATFVEMSKGSADPASAAVLRYLVMRNSDSAGSDEAAKLLKTLLPPPALQALASKQPIPPEAQMQMQQMGQKMQQMGQEMQKMQQENVQLKAGAQEGMAKVQVDAQEGQAKLQLAQQEAQAELALQKQKQDGELQLAREKAQAEIAIKQSVAEAEYGIEQRKMEFDHACKSAEANFKLEERARTEQAPLLENAMPAFMQALGQISQSFTGALATQQAAMTEIAQAVTVANRPKTITAKSSTGTTMTATVN
jgi:hypothetical protein